MGCHPSSRAKSRHSTEGPALSVFYPALVEKQESQDQKLEPLLRLSFSELKGKNGFSADTMAKKQVETFLQVGTIPDGRILFAVRNEVLTDRGERWNALRSRSAQSAVPRTDTKKLLLRTLRSSERSEFQQLVRLETMTHTNAEAVTTALAGDLVVHEVRIQIRTLGQIVVIAD